MFPEQPLHRQSRQFVYADLPALLQFDVMSKPLLKTTVIIVLLSGTLFYCLKNNVRMFFVITGSMEPLIPTKSLIVSKNLMVDQIKAGMVVVFHDQENARVTAHRVDDASLDGFITKGDANVYKDKSLVQPDEIIGQVVGILPVMDVWVVALQLILIVLLFILGVVVRCFLLFLKHGFSCPTAAVNTIHRLCVFRRAKKTICGGQTDLGAG